MRSRAFATPSVNPDHKVYDDRGVDKQDDDLSFSEMPAHRTIGAGLVLRS